METIKTLDYEVLASNLKLENVPEIILDGNRRHDILLLTEVENTNINGDPDREGAPRITTLDNRAIQSDVSQKHKIRRFVEQVRDNYPAEKETLHIYFSLFQNLSEKMNSMYEELGLTPKKDSKKKASEIVDAKVQVRDELLKKYWDLRFFGSAFTEGHQALKTRGKAIFPDSFSIHPVNCYENTITRGSTNDEKEGVNQTMGRRERVRYALMQSKICYNPNNNPAQISELDMKIFWESLMFMHQNTRSTTRDTGVNPRGLFIFSHEKPRGSALDWMLYDLFKFDLVEEIKNDPANELDIPTKFSDYVISLDSENLPNGVQLTRLI